jgi:hypothetical protein
MVNEVIDGVSPNMLAITSIHDFAAVPQLPDLDHVRVASVRKYGANLLSSNAG